jgi:acetyltransferase-like isoleucine patch superfamily enzyme
MNNRQIKLQIFFILIKAFNFFYKIIFIHFIRSILLVLAGFKVGKNTCINSVKFFSFGKLIIGNNTIINSGCYLDNRRGITIGNNVVIAHDTKIYTLGHEINDIEFITKGMPVVIEDYCVLFSNVLIMPGVIIKKGAVILPGSVVTKNVNSMEVVGGNPAHFIKLRQSLHLNKRVIKYWFSI